MKKVTIAIAIAGAVGFAGIAPLACNAFDSTVEPTTDAGGESAVSDAPGTGVDGGVDGSVSDGGADATRTISCGPETCSLPNEVCCVFYGGPAPTKFCAEGTCPAVAPVDGGENYALRTVVRCDDPTDCEAPGNVCCAASAGSCVTNIFDVVECRALANCISCADADGGSPVGYPLCRATGTSDCSGGSGCSGTFSGQEQWDDYRFCK